MAYTSEEENEIEQVKEFWRDNYKTIVGAAVIGLAGAWGWNFWQSHQIAQNQQASVIYENIINTTDVQAKNNQLAEFIKAHEQNSYAVFALLDQAKNAVQQQDFVAAETALKQAVSCAQDNNLLAISALRLALVQYQKKSYDESLESLKLVKVGGLNSAKFLLTGDIQLAKGKLDDAKESYQQALNGASPAEQQWLQIRLNNL